MKTLPILTLMCLAGCDQPATAKKPSADAPESVQVIMHIPSFHGDASSLRVLHRTFDGEKLKPDVMEFAKSLRRSDQFTPADKEDLRDADEAVRVARNLKIGMDTREGMSLLYETIEAGFTLPPDFWLETSAPIEAVSKDGDYLLRGLANGEYYIQVTPDWFVPVTISGGPAQRLEPTAPPARKQIHHQHLPGEHSDPLARYSHVR